jgi:hypothetical protein
MDGTGAAIYLFGESLPLAPGAENINNTFKYFAIIQRLSATALFPDIRFVWVPGRWRQKKLNSLPKSIGNSP